MSDLKEILYDGIAGYEKLYDVESCLAYLGYYTFLGDYKDCGERLENCRTALVEHFDRAEKDVREAKDTGTILEAVHTLQKIRDAEKNTGLPGEAVSTGSSLQQRIDRLIIIAADRAEKLKKKADRRKMQRKTAAVSAAVIFVFLMIFGAYYHSEIEPAGILAKAEQQYADGEYEEALGSYAGLSEWKEWEDESEFGLRKTHLALADRYMDQEDYISAFPHYHSAGEFEKEIDARRTAAEACASKREYEEAVKQYADLENAQEEYLRKLKLSGKGEDDPAVAPKISNLISDMEDTKQKEGEARVLWADILIGEDRIHEAIFQLEHASQTQEIGPKLKELYMKLVDRYIATMKTYPGFDAEEAGRWGSDLKDIDAQLYYCEALVSQGFDLAEVYPDGVLINDMDLGLDKYKTEGYEADPKEGRMLVLYRKEHDGRYADNSIYAILFDTLGEEAYALREYSLYLYPDLLYRLPEEKRASSWDDCDTLIMASSFYSKYMTVHGTRENRFIDSIYGDMATYDTYLCKDKISLFQKDFPYFHRTLNENLELPELKDGFSFSEIDLLNIDSMRFGRPDTEWIRSRLERAVEKFVEEVIA